MKVRFLVAFLIGILVPHLLLVSAPSVLADSEVDKLRDQISGHNNRLAEIEAEIAKYESELQEVGAEK